MSSNPQQPTLILASRSPRRRQLLTQAGYQYQILVPASADECGSCSRESPAELVLRLALQKAKDVARQLLAHPNSTAQRWLILSSDTVAEIDGQILGKPETIDHARRMLNLLRGRRHRVLSGICLWQVPDRLPDLRVAVTELQMDSLTDRQLEEYLATYAWEGKAGAFGYQDGWDWLHIIQGSESNVVGLPMELFEEMYLAWSRGGQQQ